MSRLPEIVKFTADPAAGALWTYVADEDMIVWSLNGQIATDANVANRQVFLTADDGNTANTFFRSIAATQLAASTAGAFITAFAGAPGRTPGSNWSEIPLPSSGLRLRKGDRLLIGVNNRQAGDDLTAFVADIERV